MVNKINNKTAKVSVCITVFNEKKETVEQLITALKKQTLKADEIIIIDGKDYKNCSRSQGRNLAIKKSKNEIIAITDAGCVPHVDWLKNITKPLIKNECDVVAGGYKMMTLTNFQKAASVFLGDDINTSENQLMPTARSMAFKKSIWKKVLGFPEKLRDTAEDTLFNVSLIKINAKFGSSKNAIVDWYLPENIFEFAVKIYKYAKGDVESQIWWHPIKKLRTHNIKVLTIFGRYLFLFLTFPINTFIFFSLIVFYAIYAYYKAGIWGILLQFVSDIAAIIGFSHGILQTSIKRH